MSAILQHEIPCEASDKRAGASGAWRGFKACGVTWRSSPASSRTCNTRHRRHARRQMKAPAPVGPGAGSRPVASPDVHPLHVRVPATRDIAGTRVRQINEPPPVGRGRGFEACGVTRRPSPACSLSCNTRHHRHARRQMNEPPPVGRGRGFEACGVTRRSSPASSPPCNTRHRTHARRQMNEPAPVGQGAGSRPVASPGVHPLHVRTTATRDITGTQGVR